MLKAVAAGNPDDAIPDFVAFERLKSFGYIIIKNEQPKITPEGKQALWEKPPGDGPEGVRN
jgi:hypothetical protein